MWVKALDILMEKLRICGVDFSEVAGISGCGQQHGTVYWRAGAGDMLRGASADKFLHDELAHAFSVLDSPIWMDSSTGEECRRMEERVGGRQVHLLYVRQQCRRGRRRRWRRRRRRRRTKTRTRTWRKRRKRRRKNVLYLTIIFDFPFKSLCELTGSRAFERFSGPQIARVASERPEAFAHTERVSLVSSFACSLFLGEVAPIDWADGSGMALMVRSKKEKVLVITGVIPVIMNRLLTGLLLSFKKLFFL